MTLSRTEIQILEKREAIIALWNAHRGTTIPVSGKENWDQWDKWDQWDDFDRINFIQFDDDGNPTGIEIGGH
jgi:hypothetical protein